MTDIATLDTSNYAAMAKAMGIAYETNTTKTSMLARLRISHNAIMGQAEVKGKTVNVEAVPGGMYKLEAADQEPVYAPQVIIRPFVQRFMHKRFVKGNDKTPNRYVKTIMTDNLNNDMKDNDGGFNCGKPAGWIADFKALPESMQALIKQIKRVRAIFGTVELVDAVDGSGNPVDVAPTPFIWEIDNRDAFKSSGEVFTKLGKMRRLPAQHTFTGTTKEQKLPNGDSFYLPAFQLDLTKTLDLDTGSQETLGNFLAWIANYNQYIINEWDAHVGDKESVDGELIEEFVDVDMEDFV